MRKLDDNEGAFESDPMQGQSLFEYLEVFKRRWIVLVAAIIIVTVTGTLYNRHQRKLYTSSSSIAVSSGGSGGGIGASGNLISNIEALNRGRNVETQAAILSSPDLLHVAYAKMSLKDRLRGFNGVGIPGWAFELEQKKGIDIITVRTMSYVPELAAKLADNIIETYLESDQKRNSSAAHAGRLFVGIERDKIKDQLVAATEKLARYSSKSGMVVPASQISDQAKMLADAQSDLDKTRVNANAERLEAESVAAQIKRQDPEIKLGTVTTSTPDFEQARARISALQGKLAEQRQTFQEDSVEINDAKRDLAEEEAHLRKISKTMVSSVSTTRNTTLDRLLDLYGATLAQSVLDSEKAKGLETYVRARKAQFDEVPEKGRHFDEYKESVDALLRTYDLLSDRYYSLLIEEASSIPNGFVVTTAAVPLGPSFPNTSRGFSISLLLGILTGILAAMALERLDTRIHDPAVVERMTGLTVLTSVPETKRGADVPITALTIGSGDTSSGFAESFRLLRHNIAFSAPDREMKILAVTSAGKGDGKSTTAVNLAIALALDGNRVLLVDGDLRRPALHNYLGVSRDVGFTNVVRGLITLKDAILPTQFNGVFCLPTGPLPPNPSEFLNSSLARDLIAEGAREFDYVLVDCPPCTGLSDVQVISTLVQGIVLVVAIDTTEKQYLAGAIRLLTLAGAPLLGVVLNRVRYNRASYYSYYSYYYYYGYYHEDEPTKGKKGKKNGRGGKAT